MSTPATGTLIEQDQSPSGHVDPWRVQAFAHALIAQFLAAGERHPGAERIVQSANELRALSEVGAYGRAVKQRVVAAAAVYFRLFLPTVEWTFSGSEVFSPSARFYLVWRSTAGTLVDELIASRVATQLERKALRERARRDAISRRSKFGEKFVGLRMVILGSPRRSFLTSFDGRETDIEWETIR